MEPCPEDARTPNFFAAPWCWRWLAGLLIVGSAAFHVLFLVNECPLDLSCDEAHYWDWSRHPDWSYYSKGPLVAWIIRASCVIAGDWSRHMIGSEMLAVRLPAVACGVLLLISLYVLTRQVFREERLAFLVVLFAVSQPAVAVGASLMTIDAPYTCAWGWAMVAGHAAIFDRKAWAWPVAGLLVGLGILAKYTMVIWLPSVGLFLLCSPTYRGCLRRPGFWIMTTVAALCCIPIVIWNARHDWVTLMHNLGHAGVGSNQGPRLWGPLEYVGVQAALLLGYWFVAWVAALIAYRPDRGTDATSYLWWLSAPMFALFLGFSFKTAIQPNWPVTAYLSGLILATAWLVNQWRSPVVWYRSVALAFSAIFCIAGLTVTAVVHHTTTIWPLIAVVAGPPTAEQPFPLRRFDPTCRLRGWRTVAAEVDRLRGQLRAEAGEPLVAGVGWSLPGVLGFYCDGHPQVYTFGLKLGDRQSQYDLWLPNPIATPDAFRGRTFILVGCNATPTISSAFERTEPTRVVVHQEAGQPIALWPITVCHGFRGFANEQIGPIKH